MSSPALQLRQRAPRFAEGAISKARLSVVPRRRVRAARMPFVTLVSLVLVGGIVGLLCFNTQMQQASFAAASLQSQADTLTAREQTLHDDLQSLRDPQHLATLAQGAGMVAPESSCTVRLAAGAATGTTTQDCAAATDANTPSLLGKAPAKPKVLNPKATVVTVEGAPVIAHQGKHKNKGRNAGAR